MGHSDDMASMNPDIPVGDKRSRQHNRSKSNVLASFMQRKAEQDGSAQIPTQQRPLSIAIPQSVPRHEMAFPMSPHPVALGEIQNQAAGSSRSPMKSDDRFAAPRSPTKHGFIPAPFKSSPTKELAKAVKAAKNKDDPFTFEKPKKTRSTTNLVALLRRPKSQKSLQKQEEEEKEMYMKKDKENQTPPASGTHQEPSRPPIYAQFSSGALERQTGLMESNDVFSSTSSKARSGSPMSKERPKSYHAYAARGAQSNTVIGSGSSKSPSRLQRGLKMFASGTGSRSKPLAESPEFILDPKDIDKHLEAMLDRRNIPEHQRYKMRNLTDTIKMEFIRQDWAESRSISGTRPGSHDSERSMPEAQEKRPRGRSFTWTRSSGKKSESRSPTKKTKGEGTLGRHFRARSTESFASERPSSAGSNNTGSGILSKMKLQQGPADYVNYLRKVQRPEAVEVGKLHKLRLLLRNETVTWTEEFIRQGGMQEIVGLLHRIMEVEWR